MHIQAGWSIITKGVWSIAENTDLKLTVTTLPIFTSRHSDLSTVRLYRYFHVFGSYQFLLHIEISEGSPEFHKKGPQEFFLCLDLYQ